MLISALLFIRKNSTIIFIVLIILLLFILITQRGDIIDLKSSNNDFKDIITSDSLKEWKDKGGNNHVSGDVFKVEKETLRLLIEQDKKILLSLDTKLKKLDGYRITVVGSEINSQTILRDSTINDTVTIKVFEDKDKKGFYTFKGKILGDSIFSEISIVDSLIAGISKGKCKKRIFFNLIGIGRRTYQVELINKNPYNKILFNKEVYLDKNSD